MRTREAWDLVVNSADSDGRGFAMGTDPPVYMDYFRTSPEDNMIHAIPLRVSTNNHLWERVKNCELHKGSQRVIGT